MAVKQRGPGKKVIKVMVGPLDGGKWENHVITI